MTEEVRAEGRKFIAHRRKNGDEQLLETHLQNVGILASEFALKINAADAGRLIGQLHDFGKYSQAFQNYIKPATGVINPDEDEDFREMKGRIDHSTAGAQLVWRQCQKWGDHGKLAGKILSLCIASHHSGLIDCLAPSGDDIHDKRMKKEDEKTHLQECQQHVPSEFLNGVTVCINKDLIAEIVSEIEKTTSGKAKLIQNFNLGFFVRLLFSCLIDADRIDSAVFETLGNIRHRSASKPNWAVAIQRFEKSLADMSGDKPIDSIRRNISQACRDRAESDPGMFSLTVPTGGGKTYASLRFALHHAGRHKMDRIIYVIPYTSIIEQNAEAIRKVIEDTSDETPWVLEQHSNLEPEKQTWHSKLVSENWDAPIVLTTMVQFLEVLFSRGTRHVRKLHQLTNSILIFDEIQTLPVKCTHLFCNAMNCLTEFYHSTAVLCTATQPLLNQLPDRVRDKGQINLEPENEIVSDIEALFDQLKRVRLSNQCRSPGWSENEIVQLALEEFQKKGSCLIIVNTKEWARKLYDALCPQMHKDELFHLSTNLCPEHRKCYLQRVRERLDSGSPVLCISTQLIEAGVDVDFASVIRFLAGLDSIAQAAGRCNRNGLKDEAVVHVLNPKDEKIDFLTEIKIGRDKARRVLGEEEFKDNMLAPDAMQRYFRYYFFDRADEMSYPLTAKQLGRDDNLLNLLSKNRNVNGKKSLLSQSFMTAGKHFEAIDAPTRAIIVPYDEKARKLITDLCAVAKEFDGRRYRSLLRDAQRYSVNVFPNVWDRLKRADTIHETQPDEGIYFLDERYYSPELGLCDEPCNTMNSSIVC